MNDPGKRWEATILLVEPKVLVRMVLADFLRECAYKVIEATNFEEAISILKDGEISVDVVLSEVELPGASDGFSLARWIRENRPLAKVQLVGTIPRAASTAVELCEETSVLARPGSHQAIVDRIKQLLAAADRNSRKSSYTPGGGI